MTRNDIASAHGFDIMAILRTAGDYVSRKWENATD